MHTPLLPRHPPQVMPMMGFQLDYCFFNHVEKNKNCAYMSICHAWMSNQEKI